MPNNAVVTSVIIATFHALDELFGERVQGSKFFIPTQEFEGMDNSVRVIYSKPVEKIMAGDNAKSIIMTQVKVESGYNLQDRFSYRENEPNIKSRPVTLTTGNQAYSTERSIDTKTLVQLFVLTRDNVLINFSTTDEDLEELIKMAESLQ